MITEYIDLGDREMCGIDPVGPVDNEFLGCKTLDKRRNFFGP